MLIQKIYKIQNILKDMNVDGWLIYYFKGSNDIANKILNIPSDLHITRRFYYFIPKIGDPVQIVSAVESNVLNKLNLPGKKVVYSNLSSLKYELSYILSDIKTVAMEYSPNNMIPYISKVDAGTIELIRSYGINVVSSGDIIARLVAIWTKDQYEENKMVSKNLYKIVKDAFQYIGEAISQNKIITEYDV